MNIKIENFTYKISDKILFENVNYEFKNQVYQIVSNNGCGKSSFFNCLYKLEKQYNGNIYLDLKNLKNINKQKLRNEYISYIYQEDVFFAELSILDNLKFFLKDKIKIKNLLIHLNMYLQVKESDIIKNLSGGQRQYINVLMGLNLNRKIYLLDEPFNNLSKEKIKILVKVLNESKKLIILINHKEHDIGKKIQVRRREFIDEIS